MYIVYYPPLSLQLHKIGNSPISEITKRRAKEAKALLTFTEL